ncbi:MAG TPA: SAM-dependent methyltransferase [Trebonia sp.]|nr:SAM-dependent methyltransferase [Trebonia sp.]
MEGIDTSKPNIARVYDYWLGGKDNFAADRRLAERLAATWPPWVDACRDNRKFVCRTVTWAAQRGIRQFLDLGAGLPTRPSVHETARDADENARVAYVDNDPIVVSHTQALMARSNGVTAARANLEDPDAVFAAEEVRDLIDPSEPVCVIFAMVLHFFDAATARAIAGGYVERLAPGSMVVISCSRIDDDEILEVVRRDYSPGPVPNHSREAVLSFFQGLDVVPPGLVPTDAWRGGFPRVPAKPPGAAYVLGAVGIKPLARPGRGCPVLR